MGLPYSNKVLEYFTNPKNVGEIKDADAVATEGSPACGDMVKLFLKVDNNSKKIKDIKFKSYGCASNIATASVITELAMGKSIDEAKNITWQQAAEMLEGLPAVKVHCAVLAVDALKTAIENYEHKHNILTDKKKTDYDVVFYRLKHVINPITGREITDPKFLNNIEIKDDVIKVYINLSATHQFAANIKDEIIERLEPLWDITRIEVFFSDK